MGQTCHIIKVASLNFSGINTSPFEYNDGSQLFKDLNKNYQLIKQAEFPQMIKWVGALLEKFYKTDRFTVLFGDQLISKLEGRLFSNQQFAQLWRKHYQSAKAEKKIANNYIASPQEESDVLKMDFSFYRAVVMTVYGYNTIEEYNQKASYQFAWKLKTFLQDLRKRPPFQLTFKKEMVQKYYKNVDVMFLQEADAVEWNSSHKGCTVFKNHGSVIIFRTQIFGELDVSETRKWQELLDINKDTAVVVTRHKFLLVSSHFTSTQQGYLEQQQQLFIGLNKVIGNSGSDLKIIVGVDANHLITTPTLARQCYIVPFDSQQSTTIKRRSYIQAQLHKADQSIDEVKDHIISTLEIDNHELQLINGKKSERESLPNDQHPYDHFVLRANIKRNIGTCFG